MEFPPMETFCPELLCLCVFVLLFRFILLTQEKVLRSLLKKQRRQDIKIRMERVFSAGKMGICFSWTHCFFSSNHPGLPTKTSGSKLLQVPSKDTCAGSRGAVAVFQELKTS